MADNLDEELGFIPEHEMTSTSDDDLGFIPEKSLLEKITSNIQKTGEDIINPVSNVGTGIIDKFSEKSIDTARGVGQGLLAGAVDELGGLGSALYEKYSDLTDPTNEALREQGFNIESPEFAELYRRNQQAIDKELRESADRSPLLYTTGQISGGIAAGNILGSAGNMLGKAIGLGGGAPKTVASLAQIAKDEGKLKALGELGIRAGSSFIKQTPGMALESALSSEKGGLLNEQERNKLLEDVTGGLLFAAPTVAGLHVATDVAIPVGKELSQGVKDWGRKYLEEKPLLSQMEIAYNYGKQGINPRSMINKTETSLEKLGLSGLDDARSYKLRDEILGAQKKLGAGIGQSLENSNKIIDINSQVKDAMDNIEALAVKNPDIADNTRARSVFKRILTGETKVTAPEAKALLDDIDTYIKRFQNFESLTRQDRDILNVLYDNRKILSNSIKAQIPEYATATSRYADFMKLVPEAAVGNTIFDINNNPVQISKKFFGEINDSDKRLFTDMKRMIQGTMKEGSGTNPIRERFGNTMKGLKLFEQKEADRFSKGLINDSVFARNASQIEKEIKNFSNDAVARNSMDAIEPHTGIPKTFENLLLGAGETGRSMSLSAANIAGRLSKNSSESKNIVSRIAHSIYDAPNETTLALAQKLKQVPELQRYGVQLEEALNNTDANRRNQALFVIMQNPKARAFIKDENQVETDQP